MGETNFMILSEWDFMGGKNVMIFISERDFMGRKKFYEFTMFTFLALINFTILPLRGIS